MSRVLHSFSHYNRYHRDCVGGWSGTVGYDTGGYTLYFNVMPLSAPYVGVALCSPLDRYSRKFGRSLAMERQRLVYLKYPQREAVEAGFGVINIPSVYAAGADTERGKLHQAAMLHALQVLSAYYDLVELRIVDLGPWQERKKENE